MTWSLYRWTWLLESPVYIGMPPGGSLNRCRIYVPARRIWGAVTAEIARAEAPTRFPSTTTWKRNSEICALYLPLSGRKS